MRTTESRSLRLLLWNDNKEAGKAWLEIATADGFTDSELVTSMDPDEVLKRFEEQFPDAVVLDIMADDRSPVGLEIARRLREIDPLVPIIAITKYPNEVYGAKSDIDSYGFCGIYHDTVVQRIMFREVAIRYSLDHWYVTLHEHALVRTALRALKQRVDNCENDRILGTIVECLRALPFSASIEAWHRDLCDAVGRALKEAGHAELAKAYRTIVHTFEEADPFFMAAKLGRRHLSHNVQVFLIGLIVLLSDTELWGDALGAMRTLDCAVNKDTPYVESLLAWACIGTTHDVAYLSQHLSGVTQKLLQIAERFRNAFDPLPPLPVAWDWPTEHHAKVGASLWRKLDILRPSDKALAGLIADAIERHDSSIWPDNIVDTNMWAKFLVVLSDELQDWHRDRKELPPGSDGREETPWRSFALEVFRVDQDKATNEVRLSASFVVRDFPVLVAIEKGTVGTRSVENRFAIILGTLKQNLRTKHRWHIELSARFVSRGNRVAIQGDDLALISSR